jgi:hypothetical protein
VFRVTSTGGRHAGSGIAVPTSATGSTTLPASTPCGQMHHDHQLAGRVALSTAEAVDDWKGYWSDWLEAVDEA